MYLSAIGLRQSKQSIQNIIRYWNLYRRHEINLGAIVPNINRIFFSSFIPLAGSVRFWGEWMVHCQRIECIQCYSNQCRMQTKKKLVCVRGKSCRRLRRRHVRLHRKISEIKKNKQKILQSPLIDTSEPYYFSCCPSWCWRVQGIFRHFQLLSARRGTLHIV